MILHSQILHSRALRINCAYIRQIFNSNLKSILYSFPMMNWEFHLQGHFQSDCQTCNGSTVPHITCIATYPALSIRYRSDRVSFASNIAKSAICFCSNWHFSSKSRQIRRPGSPNRSLFSRHEIHRVKTRHKLKLKTTIVTTIPAARRNGNQQPTDPLSWFLCRQIHGQLIHKHTTDRIKNYIDQLKLIACSYAPQRQILET